MYSFGFRHLYNDLLQEVEALVGEDMDPPGQLRVEVVLTLHIGQIESNLPELADFMLPKACRVTKSNHRIGVTRKYNMDAGTCNWRLRWNDCYRNQMAALPVVFVNWRY